MPFVLTPQGLQTQTQSEVRAELIARLRSIFGDDIDDDTESNFGQVCDIVGEYMAYYQQVALASHRSMDPNAAQGVTLDQRAALTGSKRIAAYGSSVVITVEVDGPTEILDGTVIRNVDTGTLWEAYNGPYNFGPVPATEEVFFRSLDTGPIPALAGAEWEAVDTIDNLESLTNAADATLGAPVETDAAFRARRQRELYAPGLGPLSSINARVSRVSTPNGKVVLVRTYHNPRTPGVDANGIPFKAFNVVVRTDPDPPTDKLKQDIWNAIFAATGAGGEAYGTDAVGTVTDSELAVHPVAFDLLDNVPMHIEVDLTTSTSEVAVTPNLEAIVAQALLDEAIGLHEVSGRDVLAWDYISVVGKLVAAGEITGVDGVVARIKATGDPSFVTTKRVISIREIADFDSSRITVTQV